MTEQKITNRQAEILEYIKQTILNVGYPPAVREICEAVNLKSTSSVHLHLETLERKGYIRRDPTKPRTIEIVDSSMNLAKREVVNIPIIDAPILTEKNITSYFPMPIEMLPNSETFALKVKGKSMTDAGIYEGDQVIVEQTKAIKNGDIVVTMLNDFINLFRYFKEKGHYRLQPENIDMEPVIVDNVKILGKVIGVIRIM